jgi:hypothetical protein
MLALFSLAPDHQSAKRRNSANMAVFSPVMSAITGNPEWPLKE